MKIRCHHPALLAAAALAACATGPRDWREVQRERLERAHRDVSLDEALRLAIESAPAGSTAAPVRTPPPVVPPPQEPRRHIDQQEPPRPGTGPRPFRAPLQPLQATADYGIGRAGANVHGARYDDRTDAQFVRVAVDAGNGAALHADLISSDGDLFADVRHNDGVDPAWADAGLFELDVFPHHRFDTGYGAVRVGAFVDWLRLDHEPSQVTRDWLGIGPRLAWQPELRLLGDGDRALDLYLRAAGDVGATWFREHYRGGADGDLTWRWGGEIGAGLRLGLGRAHAELGARFRQSNVQDLDGELFGAHSRSSFGSEQIYFGFGLRY